MDTDIPFNLNLSDSYQPSKAKPTPHSVLKSNITIVSSTGICTQSVQWCKCAKSPDRFVELLLCAKLFLASFKNPKTAFMFEVLDHFQVDALECNTAAMNFMSKLRRLLTKPFHPMCQ
jgi:hypothetical protein